MVDGNDDTRFRTAVSSDRCRPTAAVTDGRRSGAGGVGTVEERLDPDVFRLTR